MSVTLIEEWSLIFFWQNYKRHTQQRVQLPMHDLSKKYNRAQCTWWVGKERRLLQHVRRHEVLGREDDHGLLVEVIGVLIDGNVINAVRVLVGTLKLVEAGVDPVGQVGKVSGRWLAHFFNAVIFSGECGFATYEMKGKLKINIWWHFCIASTAERK